jgi:CubicO group peptidase (beta-lactamase class C family)
VSVDDLGSLVAEWPVRTASVGVTGPERTLGMAGGPDWVTRIASVGKLIVGLTALVAVEEGTIQLDEPAGPKGSTVRHLLAHASGLAFDADRSIAAPGRRRIYSNAGIERFAEHLAVRAGMPFEVYMRLGVLEPLAMSDTELRGSPAYDVWSAASDLLAFSRELLRPTLVSKQTLAEAVLPQFPDLAWSASRRRSVRSKSVGAHVRDPRWQAAALDGQPQLPGDVRALRRVGRVRLGRSRGGVGDGWPNRSGLRTVGAGVLACFSDAVLKRYIASL